MLAEIDRVCITTEYWVIDRLNVCNMRLAAPYKNLRMSVLGSELRTIKRFLKLADFALPAVVRL